MLKDVSKIMDSQYNIVCICYIFFVFFTSLFNVQFFEFYSLFQSMQVENQPQQQQNLIKNQISLQFISFPQDIQEQKIKSIILPDTTQHIFIATESHVIHLIEQQGNVRYQNVYQFQNQQGYNIKSLCINNKTLYVCLASKQTVQSKIFYGSISQLIKQKKFNLLSQVNSYIESFCIIDDKIIYSTNENKLLGQNRSDVVELFNGNNVKNARVISPLTIDSSNECYWYIMNTQKEAQLHCLYGQKNLTHSSFKELTIRTVVKNFVFFDNGKVYNLETNQYFTTSSEFTNMYFINSELILQKGNKYFQFNIGQQRLKAISLVQTKPMALFQTGLTHQQLVFQEGGTLAFMDIFRNSQVKDPIQFSSMIYMNSYKYMLKSNNQINIYNKQLLQPKIQMEYLQDGKIQTINNKIVQFTGSLVVIYDVQANKQNKYQLEASDCQNFQTQIVNNLFIISYTCALNYKLTVLYEDQISKRILPMIEVEFESPIIQYYTYRNQYFVVDTESDVYVYDSIKQEKYVIVQKQMELYKKVKVLPINQQVFLLMFQQQILLYNLTRPLDKQTIDSNPLSSYFDNNVVYILTESKTIQLLDITTLALIKIIDIDEDFDKNSTFMWENDQQSIFLNIIGPNKQLTYEITA